MQGDGRTRSISDRVRDTSRRVSRPEASGAVARCPQQPVFEARIVGDALVRRDGKVKLTWEWTTKPPRGGGTADWSSKLGRFSKPRGDTVFWYPPQHFVSSRMDDVIVEAHCGITKALLRLTVVRVVIDEIAAKPNNQYALNDHYVVQATAVEVLEGWSVRYRCHVEPALPAATFSWSRIGEDGTSTDIGNGAELEVQEPHAGNWRVRARVSLGGASCPSPSRKLMVCSCEAYVDVRGTKQPCPILEAKASYHRLPQRIEGDDSRRAQTHNQHVWHNYGRWPGRYDVSKPEAVSFDSGHSTNPAIRFWGGVWWRHGSPKGTKFRQGFIQAVKKNEIHARVEFRELNWAAGLKSGVRINFPTVAKWRERKLGRYLNDAPKGRYLYGEGSSRQRDDGSHPLDQNITDCDTPGFDTMPRIPIHHEEGAFIKKPLIPTSFVTYEHIEPHVYDAEFILWIVVFNTETNQYIPLGQAEWRLRIDSSETGPWQCSVGAPHDPDQALSDGSRTSSLTKRGWKGEAVIDAYSE